MPLAAIALVALGAGGVLVVSAGNQIIKHDNGSVGVMIRWASGFVLVVAAVLTGVFHL